MLGLAAGLNFFLNGATSIGWGVASDQCGAVREAPMDSPLRRQLQRSLKNEGFRVGAQPLEMHGRCERCAP